MASEKASKAHKKVVETEIEYKNVKYTCSCGAVYAVGSTIGQDTHIEICANCHPFYTKKQKLVDTGGRVEKFNKRFAMATPKKKPEKKSDKA